MAEGLVGAVGTNNFPLVKELIGTGMDVNGVDQHGKTGLHWAVYNGSVECAKLLLEAKADVNRPNHNGWTPLHVASLAGGAECVKVGCDIVFLFLFSFHAVGWSAPR